MESKNYLLSDLSKDERSLLLFFETCCVDYAGAIDMRRMNTEDSQTAHNWHREGFIKFERIHSSYWMNDGCEKRTQSVNLSENAWRLAHQERRSRFGRKNEKRTWKTIKEEDFQVSPQQ